MSAWRTTRMALMIALLLFFSAGCGILGHGKNDGLAGGSYSGSSSNNAEDNANSNSGGSDGNSNASDGSGAANAGSSDDNAGNASSNNGVENDNPADSSSVKVTMGKVTAVRLADPQSGWVGGKGWIARTDDGGSHWQVQYQGEQYVNQLFALNDKDAWAIFSDSSTQTDKARLMQTTDGGKHWAPVSRMPNTGFLHFVSMSEAFAGNAHSTDGGKTWTALAVPGNMVGDAYFHDRNNGWAVTQEKGKLIVKRTTDGGKSWKTVMQRDTVSGLNGALIRSAGANDAWIECIGDSGMTQTSYSLFHTADGGNHWQTVIANATAGGGPAPGFPADYISGPHNGGSKPGPLYVVNPEIAYMGGQCPACDNPNSIGWTKDGGKTWTNGKQQFPGFGDALLAIADAEHGWWISTDNADPSVMYTTSDGGKTWKKAHTFDKPEA